MNGDGTFYLGRTFAPDQGRVTPDAYLYPATDLTTHAVVLGMTGSGKTGLCLDLLEEAIDEGIPVIVVDPKGDVSNLALLFPDLAPADFRPWVSPAEATRRGLSIDELAAETAGTWRKGLAGWDIDAGRLARIRARMDLRLFTPGSSAGQPVRIVEGFSRPAGDFQANEEALVEKIRTSVSALLSLLDEDSDPLTGKAHILLSSIIEHFWRLGRDVSLEELILNIQKPPITRLGVFEVDRVMDERERIGLAFKINNLMASPSFRFWNAGHSLSAGALYSSADGRIPVNIFYIAHLSDNERMFFVSLLLNEIGYWIRTQPGATDLKYLFYMDEIYGYLPAYPKNPPSKPPLLTLLKQARAFGLGVVLVTQNPKDLDYKGLTNIGSWFIGRLQAEGDRERVMEGLRGVGGTDPGEIEDVISDLPKRVFLVRNVHAGGIALFQTRWAMSYLAGPLTREQLRPLVEPQSSPSPVAGPAAPARVAGLAPPAPVPDSDFLPRPPEPDVPLEVLFEDKRSVAGTHYRPGLHFAGELIFDDSKFGIYVRRKLFTTAPLAETIHWEEIPVVEEPAEYAATPDEALGGFAPLGVKVDYTTLRRWQTEFRNHLYATLSLNLRVNPSLKLASEPDEQEEAFRQRCRDVVEKMIDKDVEKLKTSYGRKVERITDRIEREKVNLAKLEQEYQSRKTEELFSIGESVFGLLLGSRSRRGLSAAARKRRMTASSGNRLEMEKTQLSQLEEEARALREELEDKIAAIEDAHYETADRIEPLDIRLEKDDIIISRQALVWIPAP